MSEHERPGRACNCGVRGWMPGVEHVPVEWGRPSWVTDREGKMTPVLIVDHVMQGWLNTMVSYARNAYPAAEMRYVTPHFNIGTGGRCVQIESIFTPGIHATTLNSPTAKRVLERLSSPYGASLYSVGIEHEGFSRELFDDPAKMTATLRENTWTPDNPWPEAMVRKSIEVKRWILEQCPQMGGASTDSIVGHSEVDAKNRPDDPQRHDYTDVWPRARMIAALAPAVQLTAEQAEMVALIRANRAHLSDADVAYALSTVGLTAMPGETPAPGTPPPPPAPVPAPKPPASTPPAGTPAAKRAEIEALLDDVAEALMVASSALIQARLKNRSA